MEKRVRREDEDRISKLPLDLKHQILYYLSIKEAASTSVLSTLWTDVWLTLPWLRLDKPFFQHILLTHPALKNSHEHILTFIDHQIFKRRRVYNNNFMLNHLILHIPRLNFRGGDNLPELTISLLNRFLVWVVVEFQVKKIDFALGYRQDSYKGLWLPRNSDISPTVASWKELAQVSELKLSGCVLNSCLETSWSTIRILYLKRVNLLHQQLLDSVMAHCPLIKSLSIVDCIGEFDTLNALDLKRLVNLYIYDRRNYFKMIQIDAPKLENIYTLHSIDGRTIESTGSCIIRNLAVSKRLKSLKIICNARITDEWLNHIGIDNLSNLKQLNLGSCHNLKRVRISSKSLDTIYLSSNGLEELKIVYVPRLLYLKFWCWYANRSLPTPSFVFNDATRASAMSNLWLRGYNYTDKALECEKLVKFLGNFNVWRRLKLYFFGGIVVPSDIRKLLNPPLVVKDQKLNYVVYFYKRNTNINQVIDSLFWLSAYGPETITIDFDLNASKKFEFEYKEDDNALEKCGYCESLPVRCWRHCLEKVTIINSGGLKHSTINATRDDELEEFFKTATNPRNIVVKIIDL